MTVFVSGGAWPVAWRWMWHWS